jgi:hypothetical protein
LSHFLSLRSKYSGRTCVAAVIAFSSLLSSCGLVLAHDSFDGFEAGSEQEEDVGVDGGWVGAGVGAGAGATVGVGVGVALGSTTGIERTGCVALGVGVALGSVGSASFTALQPPASTQEARTKRM